MLHNPTYYGQHSFHSRHGMIPREVPALISSDIWEKVQAQLKRNATLPKPNAQRLYLLRGLLVCSHCGRRYQGCVERKGAWERCYYRCGSFRHARPGTPRPPSCPGRKVPALQIEALVWDRCRALIHDPETAIVETRARLNEDPGQRQRQEATLAHLEVSLAQKAQERERVITMSRRGHITYAEFERQIEHIAQETRMLHHG